MSRDMCADLKMEENYMRMSIEYNNDDSRVKIQQAIDTIEKQTQLYPTVFRKAISNEAGNFSIEFETEGTQRDAGEFCEALLKELGIDHCEA